MTRKGGAGVEAWRAAAIAGALALGSLVCLPSAALALSELPREDVPVPDVPEGADAIERHELPPPGEPATPEADGDVDDDAGEGVGEDVENTEDAPQEQTPAEQAPTPPRITIPLPDPIVIPRDPDKDNPVEVEGAEDEDEPVPEVLYDLSLLPEPVRRMRDLIVEACLSGDIERLRPLVGSGDSATQLSFGATSGDPIAFLRELSGDEEGHEILAILYEVLTAGYVKLGEGTPEEMYVWPYFFAVPLGELTPRQRVELFKIVTAGDYEDMKNYGAYIFYRTGISPEGRWLFFVAGD